MSYFFSLNYVKMLFLGLKCQQFHMDQPIRLTHAFARIELIFSGQAGISPIWVFRKEFHILAEKNQVSIPPWSQQASHWGYVRRWWSAAEPDSWTGLDGTQSACISDVCWLNIFGYSENFIIMIDRWLLQDYLWLWISSGNQASAFKEKAS